MKLTRKIVAFFILGLLLLPVASRILQASEESNTVNVDITYVFDGENPSIEADANGLAYGSTLQLTPSNHAGYTWAYWIVNGVVRTDLPQNHTFRVSSNLTLQGIYAPVGKHTVVFLDSNGQLIESQFVNDQGVATLPNVDSKSKPGLQVSASTPWKTSTGSVFNVATPITANTVVILQYETTVANTYLMTVNGIEEGPYNFNQLVSVEADAVDVSLNPFSHWEENGVIVSRSLEYVFTAVKNRTLTAVYAETPEADTPLVVLTRDIEQRSGYHTYVGQFYLPETGYELVEYGFLIDEVNTLDLTKDNADYVVPVANYTEASNEFVMSFPIGSHLNVRAYFTYKVGTSVLTVYSDENPRYINEVTYQTGFENATKGSYAAGDVDVDGLSLRLSDALIGTLSGDVKDGLKSVRIQSSGFIQTNSPIDDLYSVTFSVAKYGSDADAYVDVFVSADNVEWIEITDSLISGEISVNTTTLTEYTLEISDSLNFKNSSIISSQPLYVKISKTGGNRVNIDNLQLNSLYKSLSELVTFNNDGNISNSLVKTNTSLSQPANPTKTGYTFDGWYLEDTFVTLYNFSTPVTSDLTLYAKFTINEYTISFNSNGGTSVSSIVDDYNATVLEPTSPTKDGYLFDDWYSDAGLTTPYVFDTMPANNVTLYAGWNLDTFDINYVLDSGVNSLSNPATYTIETSTITLEPATKDGYTFGGWYDNSEFTGIAVTDIALGSFGDITLYAKFTENTGTTYNVSIYDYLGGTLLETQVVAENGFAVQPSDPTRSGYRFDTWYIDGTPDTVYNWATPVVEPITIYGEWIQTFTVTFDTDGGSAISAQTVDINDYATEPVTDPTKDGYTFDGWYNEALSVAFDFEGTPIASDTTVYAKWTENATPVYATDLFISEYYESGNQKALEIFNGTGSSIDLSIYKVSVYSNGSSTGNSITLSGTLEHNSTYVIVYNQANATLQSFGDLISSSLSFNGDDAVALKKNDIVIDVLGVIGTDPGTSWVVPGGKTEDFTVIRVSSVLSPLTTWNSSEWMASTLSTSDLGTHTTNYLNP
jgi:uncharacterized repeat protein (TIGR02543 family)